MFRIFKRPGKAPQSIDRRLDAARKVVGVINTSRIPAHLTAAKAMVDRFERMYDSSLPLRLWLDQKAEEIGLQCGQRQ